MPSRIKVRVIAGRDLPIMDPATNLTDAYVEIKLSDIFNEKTQIAHKTLHPVWNEDFRIEVPHDGTVLKHPLEFRVWDRDQFSKDDIIGIVYYDLSNLLLDKMEVTGWFPIYDTFRGIRGELHISVKLEFFGDLNSGLDLSNNVMFFSAKSVFPYLKLKDIQGFVEELIVDDDPEYHWKDNFRTSRSSNEARQYLLYKLSGKLMRQIGNKVRELGGNAVLGFQKHFDFADTFIVARGYGTACTVKQIRDTRFAESIDTLPPLELSPDPKSIEVSIKQDDIPQEVKPASMKKDLSVLKLHTDVQFLTMHSFPPPILVRMCGVVTARSVKLLPKNARSEDEQRGLRDTWWSELRDEVRAHARFLKCQFVIGYTESVTVNGDTVVLTATGTAANLKLPTQKRHDSDQETVVTIPARQKPCSFCHIPYDKDDAPFAMNLATCQMCQKKIVPEILLATVDPPAGIQIVGTGQLIEARVCRPKKKAQGESNAIIVSEGVPFLEYDLHKQLLYKLRLLGMNAIFGLRTQLCIGDNIMILYAQGTAVYLPALPRPIPLQFNTRGNDPLPIHSKLNEISVKNAKKLDKQAQSTYSYLHDKSEPAGLAPGTDTMSTLLSAINLHAEMDPKTSNTNNDAGPIAPMETKATYVVEVDDKLDEHFVSLLIEPPPPPDVYLCNTEVLPGVQVSNTSNVQFMCLVRCLEWPETREQRQLDRFFNSAFSSLYNSIVLKTRGIRPSAICGIKVNMQLGEDDELQLLFSGMVLLPSDLKSSKDLEKLEITLPSKQSKKKKKTRAADDDEEESRESKHKRKQKEKDDDDERSPSPRSPEKPGKKKERDEDDNKHSRRRESDDDEKDTRSEKSKRKERDEDDEKEGRSEKSKKKDKDEDDDKELRMKLKSSRGGDEGAILRRSTFSLEEGSSAASVSELATSSPSRPVAASTPAKPKTFTEVELTPLSYIPGARVVKLVGRVNLHFVKESFAIREQGGMSAFVHNLLLEAQKIARAHVLNLGGNCLAAYQIEHCIISEKPSKNHGYILVNINGDALLVDYSNDSGVGKKKITRASLKTAE